MSLSDQELVAVIAALERGEVLRVTHAGGRYIDVLRFEEGRPLHESFEEGAWFRSVLSRDELMERLRGAPERQLLLLLTSR